MTHAATPLTCATLRSRTASAGNTTPITASMLASTKADEYPAPYRIRKPVIAGARTPAIFAVCRRIGWRERTFSDAALPIVAFAGNCRWQDALFVSMRNAGIAWSVVCTSASLSAIQSAVAAGLGIGVLLDWTIRRNSMRVLNTSELGLSAPPAATFGLFTRSNDQTAATARLQQFLLESLALVNERTTQDQG